MIEQKKMNEGEGLRTWLTVDLCAIGENVRTVKNMIGPTVRLLAIVKGQAYGLRNIESVAKVISDNGADLFGVELLVEGVEVRKSGIKEPIVMLGPIDSSDAEKVIRYNITPTVRDQDTIVELNRIANRERLVVPVHLEYDSGFNRFGNTPDEVLSLISVISGLDSVELDGIWTHFSDGGNKQIEEETRTQFKDYLIFLKDLGNKGITIPSQHACDSATLITYPDFHLNMVRSGKLLYGLNPTPGNEIGIQLNEVISWKTKIREIRMLEPGDSISYGNMWVANSRTIVGVINVGFGDGYPASLTNRGTVLIRGKRLPVIGKVCMRAMMVDLSALDEVKAGDEVVFIGEQGNERITWQELAMTAGLSNAEFLLGVRKRVAWIYI